MRALLLGAGAAAALSGCGAASSDSGCEPLPAPARVSQTGCYSDTPKTEPVDGAIPYELNAPAAGDGAIKRRWFVLPEGATVGFHPVDSWEMPVGTILVKEFFRESTSEPAARFPVETRFLVRIALNGVAADWTGSTYRWRDDGRDADLVPPEGLLATVRGKDHLFPSHADCARCHNPVAGGPLGLQTPNLHRDGQIEALAARGIFGASAPAHVDVLAAMPATEDPATPVYERLRSWLHTNCAHCHREGAEMGSRAWGPWNVPLAETDLCGSSYDGTPFVAPGDPDGSRLLQRVLATDALMPPIATLAPDPLGVELLTGWIASLQTCSVEETNP